MKKYIRNFFKYRYLLKQLVKKGIKLKYRRSYLGIVWSLLEPLLTMLVLNFVFGTMFGNPDKQFPVYILTGRLLYGFYSVATTSSLKSISANSAIIKKVYVPKYLYPMSSVLFNYVIFLISLVDLIGVSLVLGVRPTIHLWQSVVAIILVLILAYGNGIILATVGVFFRDMEYLWSVALMIIMYTCAIFYPEDRLIKTGKSWVLKANPLYCVIKTFRDGVFGEKLNVDYLLYALIFSFGTVIIGLFIFKKQQDKFILNV